jgi:hypothetical protein
MLLKLDRIRTNGGTQPRVAMHEAVVADYAEAMEMGVKFPPVSVHYDGEVYWLSDGFHRFQAAKRVGFTEIEVDVRQGTQRDAQLFSFGANATHGLRRTNEDKRRVVAAMLADPDWVVWSNVQIAKACSVSRELVRAMRGGDSHHAELQDSASPQATAQRDAPSAPTVRKVQRGDTVYEQDTGAIGRTKPPKAPAIDPDAVLEREITNAEGEIGVAVTEMDQLRSALAAAEERVSELIEEVEWLTKAVDGDAAEELKKQAVYIRTVERMRDDYQMQNNALKAEVKRLERRLAATTGVRAHAA